MHKPTVETRAQVYALSSFGVPQDEMSKFFGLSDDTLRKHYKAEFDRAATERNAEVASFLFRAANGSALETGASHADCLKAAMFWLKTRARWRETTDLNHKSDDGSMTPGIDMSKLPTEVLEAIVAAKKDAEPG